MNLSVIKHPWVHECAPPGVDKLTYRSRLDRTLDWSLAWRPPDQRKPWIVFLHGHGSSGDQLFTRMDLRTLWLKRFRTLGLGILTPNLRGNAWMCPEAVEDLHVLLDWVRTEYRVSAFFFVSGSMGGTGNLIYSIRHPEDVAATVALCPVTDLRAYHAWCCAHPGGVRDAIRLAIESAYKGTPSQVPERYFQNIVTEHANRLTMPLFLAHATGDDLIPVQQSRELHRCLAGAARFRYVEIEGGDHDTPLHTGGMLDWMEEQGRFH